MCNISFPLSILYLITINIITFFLYGIDKWKAKRSIGSLPQHPPVLHRRHAGFAFEKDPKKTG